MDKTLPLWEGPFEIIYVDPQEDFVMAQKPNGPNSISVNNFTKVAECGDIDHKYTSTNT